MQYQRLYAGPDGETHFCDEQMDLTPTQVVAGVPSFPLVSVPATAVSFLHVPAERPAPSWHPAPRRQFMLFGVPVEVEVSDGERRTLGPGDVLLVEDTSGKGHITRGPQQEYLIVFIHLSE
jgi:hypothetical protein